MKKTAIIKKRCAIYTRKSTDEGLEQDFNSLDAQRESCEYHIKAKIHEGWELLPNRYDDGGFSGGDMHRPALAQLMTDIRAGMIDIVVVYKIDRLSRSMKDFMKLIELFDEYKVSFVSVTQSFDTETALGRLMLNILQSFAQFERENSTERIRDKFAASKRKGIWMGGPPPLGYDVRERKLEVNATEAETIQMIFTQFLKLGSTTLLMRDLNDKGYRTKSWTSIRKQRFHQGQPFTKNGLYRILSNVAYIGMVRQDNELFKGEHEAIISRELWDKVRDLIDGRAKVNTPRVPSTLAPSLLKGLLSDPDGYAMTPAASKKKDKNKTYRYYVSTQAVKKGYDVCPIKTVAAHMLEDIVVDQVKQLLTRPEWAMRILKRTNETDETRVLKALQNFETLWDELFPAEQARILQLIIKRIIVHPDKIQISYLPMGMRALVLQIAPKATFKEGKMDEDSVITVEIPVKFSSKGGRKRIVTPDGRDIVKGKASNHDASMIKALVRGFEMLDILDKNADLTARDLAEKANLDHAYVTKYVRMTQLAPDIVQSILDGRQPQTLTLSQLLRTFPDMWPEQRQHFGFGAN